MVPGALHCTVAKVTSSGKISIIKIKLTEKRKEKNVVKKCMRKTIVITFAKNETLLNQLSRLFKYIKKKKTNYL